MNEKSRVILYSALRKKISNMDVYSFTDSKTVSKNIPESSLKMSHLSTQVKSQPETPNVSDTQELGTGIRKNTLSLSIDELIKEHDSYDSVSHFKENKRVFHNKKKSDKQKLHSVITIVAWSLIAAIVIALIAVLIYVIIRGNQ